MFRLSSIAVAALAHFVVVLMALPAASQPKNTFSGRIITRQGDKLMDGPAEFRFFGIAAPNIQQNESQIRADRTNRFPDEYEIRDVYSALQRTGALATRTFSLSVYHPDDENMPVYIPARRTYNEDAFKALDLAIALGAEYNIRLIIPFIASQSFGCIRGVDEFSTLSGKPKGSFWTDEDVKADFRHFLDFILNRKNTVNGKLYKDDPAILCWQLGNEFGSYPGDRGLNWDDWSPKILAWSLEMAAYIKKIDPNHLVMEAGGADRAAFISDPNIDLISDHLYEYWNRMGGSPWELSPLAKEARAQTKGIKPLLIDEFGLGSMENIRELMKTIREEGISGGLIWGIRGHRRDGGWYYHNEGGTPVNSYHIPGFPAGFIYEETRTLYLLTRESWAIRGLSVPPVWKPAPAPVLLPFKDGFTWRGSAGATHYVIERADKPNGPFTVLRDGLHDSILQDVTKWEHSPAAQEPLVLYIDESAIPGKTYFYRIKAVNQAGSTEYSPVVKK